MVRYEIAEHSQVMFQPDQFRIFRQNDHIFEERGRKFENCLFSRRRYFRNTSSTT